LIQFQDKNKILKLAEDLDKDLELQDLDKLIPYFSEDCEIEIFGKILKGHSELKKWLEWFFNLFETIKFEPKVIMAEKDRFFEEFVIHVTFHQRTHLSVKIAEVLEYKDYKIKSLRLYLDRLQFSDILTKGFISKKVVNLIKKKSLEGLK
jgi:ketosteroid isomerase-like protein